MILNDTFALSNDVEIPKLGLGTWRIDDAVTDRAVRDAAESGYRHFDTALAYGNERGVGEGMRASGMERDTLFVTTKLVAESKTYDDAVSRIDWSLQALGLDHIDLMLIHSPQPWEAFRDGEHFFEGNLEAWRALEDAYKAGKIRAIGVSNFERKDIENLMTNGSVAPMVNQVLAHIGNTPFDLIKYCQANGILVEAYSPVAHGAALNDSDLATIAGSYGVSIAQLCIRYCLQLGLVPLPKTAKLAHMRENASVDFEISQADMRKLRGGRKDIDYGEASQFPVFGKKRSVAGLSQVA